MDVLQFSLFFVALLVGYVLLHLRLVRFEAYLREMQAIRAATERLVQQVTVASEPRLGRVEGQLDRLHADFGELREALAEVGEQVARVPTAPPVVLPAPEASPAAAQVESPAAARRREALRLRDVVETRLQQLGYGRVQVLTDLQQASSDGDLEIQVECERNQMISKGRILLRNGTVRDVALQSVANMFP
jgi:hypothetical protein